jgi:tRNA A-37 threonylcarbamoyl transferase component Bud32
MSVLLPGTVVGETYRVIRAVGAGAMGQVYEATHARLAGRYAIKVMQPQIAAHPAALERFRREAQITSSLRHPNIVHIMDFNQLPDGSPYLVMEFLEGLDLHGHLLRMGPLPLDEVVVLVGQIASALEAAHGRGVVHRDLKPQNVCLVPLPGQSRSVVKVVDFGMSKIGAAAGALTGERALIGTAAYMSPEQAIGQIDEIDHRTDQFALGVMAYQMLSGRHAFTGDSEPALLYQIVHTQPAPLTLVHPATPSRSAALAAVVGRALEKDKNKRFASILEFALAFENASGIVRAPGRARAIFDSREGVPSSPAGGPASVAPTIIEAAPAPMTTGAPVVSERPAEPKRKARPAVIVGALVVGALAGSLWALPREAPHEATQAGVTTTPATAPVPTEAPRPAPPSAEPAPAAAASVTVEIEGLPPGAIVLWDGEAATLPITTARDPSPHHLKIEAPGYLPHEADIVPDRDRTIVLGPSLTRAPAARSKRPRGRAAAVEGSGPPGP